MATYHGKDGIATYNSNEINNLQNWSVTIDLDSVEADKMGTASIATWTGHYSWSASVTGFIDDTAAPQTDPSDQSSSTLVIQGKNAANAGSMKFSGTAFCVGLSSSGSVNGVPVHTLNFEGTGELTIEASAVIGA